MKTKVFTSISIMGALGILAAMPAYALGLGKLQLSSALNEPFKAEIPITSASEEESDSLQVRLASNAEFERAGLIKSAEINALQFSVTTRAGKPVILVSSKTPVKEPLLDFLLLARTSSGQLIREYTVLLDPPKTIFKDTKAQAARYIAPSVSSAPQRQSQIQPKTVAPAPSMAGSTQYGPVSKTDTLWNIALKTRPSRDVTVHQMMVALVDKNSQAFINNNINGLKSGYTLDIPSQTEINRYSRSQAVTEVQAQNKAWKNRNNTSVAAPSAAPVAEPEKAVNTTQAPDAMAEESVSMTPSESNDGAAPVARLQLLGENEATLQENDMAAFGNEKIKALSDQLTMAQEVIESQQQENVDIKARMEAMEEQIETLRKLVALQDPDLARLQSRLEQEDDATLEAMAEDIKASLAEQLEDIPADIEAALTDSDDALDEAATDDVVVDDEIAEDAASSLARDDAVADDNDMSAEPTADANNVATSVEDDTVTPAVTTEAEPTLPEKAMQWFQQNQLQALLGALGLLLVLFLIGRKRAEKEKKVSWNEAVSGITPAETAPTPSAVATSAVAAAAVDEVAVKTSDELRDEAQLLLQNGDYEQAIEVLEQAQALEPTNQAVQHQLLSAHYQQGHVNTFTQLAEQYDVARDSMEWDEVASWGRELDADNPLFAAPITETVLDADALTDLDIDVDVPETMSDDTLAAVDEALDAEAPLEFTLPIDNDTVDLIEEVSDSDALLDDINESDLSDAVQDEIDIDLSLEADDLADITDSELEEASLALAGDSAIEGDNDLSFDLSDFDQIDEAETKLDLATAYIEMGDPDGARSILEEILVEGNEEQQSRAKTILNDLS